MGGQTPLKLSHSLDPSLVLGTPVGSIDAAEDRERWSAMCNSLGLRQPPGDVALSLDDARAIVQRVGYPVLVRPSYVLGGRAMEIVYDDVSLERVMRDLTSAHGSLAREGGVSQSRPILLDSFLEDAIEVDVDAVRDGQGDVFVAGVMEHVEEAGVHSGDSACALPPQTLSDEVLATLHAHTEKIAGALGVVGLINVQYAVKNDEVFVLEANPRASRTVPFVAKATGVALAQVAVRVMLGQTLAALREQGMVPASTPVPSFVSVKEAVLPFSRFPGVDTVLGPEMRSTGEVMGIGESFGIAFAKSQLAAGTRLPDTGQVFFSLADRDKVAGLELARQLARLGFRLAATVGTAGFLRSHDVKVDTLVGKVGLGDLAVDAVKMITSGDVQMVVNTPSGGSARSDGAAIRTACVGHGVACVTTLSAGFAAAKGIADTRAQGWRVRSLQELHS
jgi:carbamoyl-phosphate synthase large subunit